MGTTIYPTVPVAQPEAEPWPVDDHTIRVDEMFARQLDTEFSTGVRGLLHDPETGVSAQRGEAALEAIAGAMPALGELKERTLAQAIGPRQRSILEPLIETRLDWAAGTLGQLAQRATVEVDDASVADRIAGLTQDAATSWQDPAHLRKLGRTAVDELRYQGERRGWDPAETGTRVRAGLSDLYAGAVETAIRQDDLDGASALYDHAREVISPERQAAIDRRFVRTREAVVYRDVERDMEGIPIEPAGPPGAEVFAERAAELTPEDASDEVRTRIGQVAAFAQRRAERQWNKQQAEAGIAALDWVGKNPGGSVLAMPSEIRDWLAPDQWRGLETLAVEGRLKTDGDLFENLDRQMIYEPESFAAADLDRHRLSLDDEDRARFASVQKAISDGASDPAFVRYRRARLDADRAMEVKGIDTNGTDARAVRANVRDRLDNFEAIEGYAPVGADIDTIVAEEVARGPSGSAPTMEPSPGNQDDRAFEAGAAGEQRPAQPGAATTSTWVMPKVPTAGALGDVAKATIKALPRLATGAGSFALSMVIPDNFQGETVDVEDGLRITLPPGQRYVYAERRVDDGLLGSGIGARWEKLPIPMEVAEGPRGRFLRFDLDHIARVVGTPQEADRILEQLGALMARPPRKSGSDATDRGKSGTSPSPNQLPPPRPPGDISLLLAEALQVTKHVVMLNDPENTGDHYTGADRIETAVGVPLNPRLGAPDAGFDYNPTHENIRKGFMGELGLANRILRALPDDVVVYYGNAGGKNGPDVISIGPSGDVRIFDSKYRSRERAVTPSMQGLKGKVDPYRNYVLESIESAERQGRLTPERAGAARDAIDKTRVTILTIGTGNAWGGVIEQVDGASRGIIGKGGDR